MTLLVQHDLHQVNGLASQLAKEYSTPVDKTMPFSYPREHSSSGTELISQITKANNNVYQAIHTLQSIQLSQIVQKYVIQVLRITSPKKIGSLQHMSWLGIILSIMCLRSQGP